jgi:hypothetical protein
MIEAMLLGVEGWTKVFLKSKSAAPDLLRLPIRAFLRLTSS